MTDTLIYHKYTLNRRLYDVVNAGYTTVANIAVQLSLGNRVIVYEHPGKRKINAGAPLVDITNQILLQVLLEQEMAASFLNRGALLALLKKRESKSL